MRPDGILTPRRIESDKVGIGWRQELAALIGENIDTVGDIECLEVIAEEYFDASDAQQAGLAALGRLVPLALHGVSLGLASAMPLQMAVIDRMARLCEKVQPAFWSEHLSFVRSGVHEIGHLAAPPRNLETAAHAVDHAHLAARIVGTAPALENIATLIDPPCSTLSEAQWLRTIAQATGGGMLLDLHNLYANARNFHADPWEMLGGLPLDRVRQIHLSGGMMIPAPGGSQRLLDDHGHDVPEICFSLLEEVAARTDQPLFVIIERDGRYPAMDVLMDQVRHAKRSLKAGRRRRVAAADAMEVVPVLG